VNDGLFQAVIAAGDFVGVRGHPFHHELILCDELVAGVADFAAARFLRDTRDAVMRQTAIGQLLSNQSPQAYRLHDRTVSLTEALG
jgi:heat shock protein HspQ